MEGKRITRSSGQEPAADQQQTESATNEEINSQTPHDEDDRMMESPQSPPDLNTNNSGFTDTPVKSSAKSAVGQDKINHGMPGSSWSSKKFREEYDRVWNGLVDKNWEGKTLYGDPLMKK